MWVNFCTLGRMYEKILLTSNLCSVIMISHHSQTHVRFLPFPTGFRAVHKKKMDCFKALDFVNVKTGGI